MTKQLTVKMCKMCKEVEIVGHPNKKYCSEECSVEATLAYDRAKSQNKSMEKRKKLIANFQELNLKGIDLAPNNFNKKSPIRFQAYTNHYKIPWYDILKMYGEIDELTINLKEEYVKFINETGNQGMDRFAWSIGTDQSFLGYFNHDEFREYAGVQYNRRNEEEYKINFHNMVKKLGRLPLSNEEFSNHSEIPLSAHVRAFVPKGNHLEGTVKHFVSESEFEKYLVDKEAFHMAREEKRTKTLIGRTKHTDEELFIIIRRVVDQYIIDNNSLPYQSEFNSLAKISSEYFRVRFDMTYREMLKHLGYDMRLTKTTNNTTEAEVVESFSILLEEKAIPQATFDWLKGESGWALRCDGFFPSYNLVVEYDGEQHSYPVDFGGKGDEFANEKFAKTQANDAIKNTLIPQNGITLIRINYDEPYHDESFLLMRLIENGIFPSGYTEVTHSSQKSA